MRDRSLTNLSLTLLAIGACSGALVVLIQPASVAGLNRWSVGSLNVIYWGTWAALVPVAVRLASWIRSTARHQGLALAAHIVAASACAVLHLTVLSAAQLTLRGGVTTPHLALRVGDRLVATERLAWEWEFTMYAAIAVFSYAMALQAEGRQRDVAVAQLQTGLAEARLLSLQRQLQPHFLFNTLHAVAALIHRDPATAEAMIERLSGLLRTTFRSGSAAEVPFAEDLGTLEDYVAIEKEQMRARLDVAFDIDSDVADAAVPVLLMQPLVENAVRHGLQPRVAGGRVRVQARRVEDALQIDIVDDGVGLAATAAHSTGVGLANTRSRLQQLYGERHRFTVAEAPGGGVHVCVRLPFRRFIERVAPEAGARRAS